MPGSYHTLIVGAGIAGLTPALRNFVLRRAADRLYDTAFAPLRDTP